VALGLKGQAESSILKLQCDLLLSDLPYVAPINPIDALLKWKRCSFRLIFVVFVSIVSCFVSQLNFCSSLRQ